MTETHHFHLTQLGFRPDSPKPVVLSAAGSRAGRITVRVNAGYDRMIRTGNAPPDWISERFPWPFDPLAGEPGSCPGAPVRTVECVAVGTRWGRFYVGDLTGLTEPGIYTLESEHGLSLPFEIAGRLYEQIPLGYLSYTRAQRASADLPGIRPGLYLDDARRDDDGAQMLGIGGWYDAGDHRQWTSTTALHLSALAALAESGPESWREQARAELEWGRDYFLHLVDDQGRVPDNIGSGALPPGFDMSTWWFENHSGTACDDSGSRLTDGIPSSGDERIAMMHRNPHAENVVIRELAASTRAGALAQRGRARIIAERVWSRSRQLGDDRRTLFAASRLRAAVALRCLPRPIVTGEELERLAAALLGRQYRSGSAAGTLSGYFLEPDGDDAYRSIPYSCEPALALLEAAPVVSAGLSARAEEGVVAYIDDYLLADATSNPFGLPPYGVYLVDEHSDRQSYRDAGDRRWVRTFMAPWNRDLIVHGNSAVTMHQAYLLARAGSVFGRADWQAAAERILQWATGGNPQQLSLFRDIGQRHPVIFSARVPYIPGSVVTGHIGQVDDTPYLETSNAVNWNTQEVYGVPAAYAAQAAAWLNGWTTEE